MSKSAIVKVDREKTTKERPDEEEEELQSKILKHFIYN